MPKKSTILMKRRKFLKMVGFGICASGFTTPFLQSCTTKDVADFFEGLTELANLINDEREKGGLNSISLSSSLMAVSIHHVMDLNSNQPHIQCGSGGNMHSWSQNEDWKGVNGKGAWKGCCYSPDHSNMPCMHDKPKEIANYPSAGYEIVYWSSGKATPQGAITKWMSSTMGHKDVILNQGIWKSYKWEALGAACGGNYACAWFGTVKN